MSRRPIIAGNWKMNLGLEESMDLASAVRDRCNRFRDVDVVISPAAMALPMVKRRLDGSMIGLAAQNCHWEAKGAYTGELAPAQLASAGCTHVIIGHSERRQYFGETNENVGRKARSLHDQGLTPIICVGELLEHRESNQTMAVVSAQVTAAIAELTSEELGLSVIAYEPVWAIGTGRTASPEQAQEVHAQIRELVVRQAGAAAADAVRIQYGGSVKPENIRTLMSQDDIDGALVGGASLKAESFAQIVSFREEANR